MQESLALTSSFPKELSITGHLQLKRREALKMTGRLFKLRMDVNLIGGILGEFPSCVYQGAITNMTDTPELFWSEASLFPLYEAIREYLEIGPRVQVLNDRLAVAGDLVSSDDLIGYGRHELTSQLEIIHEYIEERATNRINWIIIWLIIVACVVEAVSHCRQIVLSGDLKLTITGRSSGSSSFPQFTQRRGRILVGERYKSCVGSCGR